MTIMRFDHPYFKACVGFQNVIAIDVGGDAFGDVQVGIGREFDSEISRSLLRKILFRAYDVMGWPGRPIPPGRLRIQVRECGRLYVLRILATGQGGEKHCGPSEQLVLKPESLTMVSGSTRFMVVEKLGEPAVRSRPGEIEGPATLGPSAGFLQAKR